MAAQGLLRKNFASTKFSKLFALSVIFLVSRTSILQAISKGKHSFKPLCWNVNENCDVDVAIDDAGYHSKKNYCREKSTLQVFFVFFTWPVSPSGIYGTLPLPLMLLMTTAETKTLFAWNLRVFRMELRALLIVRPPSRVRKGQFFKVEILICA